MAKEKAKKWKMGLVGFGFISAKGHLPALSLREDVEVVAVADISPGRRELAAKVLPCARIYGSHQELLEGEKDLELLDIATPPHVHSSIAVEALDRGLHVLCEKPLARCTAEARLMLMAAKRNGRVLFPCHNYKHAPVVKAIQEAIGSGNLGEIRAVTLQTFRNTHAKGVKEWRTDWRRDFHTSGGGIAMDHGSHTFYLTFSWFSALPVSLTAKTANLSSWDTEDNLMVTLEFPEKKFAHAYLSWTAGMRKVLYSVQGTKGGILVNDDRAELSLGFPPTGSHPGTIGHKKEIREIESDWMDASHTKWFHSMFDQFLSCIHSQSYVSQELKESYMCVEIIEKCYLSSRQNSAEVAVDNSFSFLGG